MKNLRWNWDDFWMYAVLAGGAVLWVLALDLLWQAAHTPLY